ncbi:MAG: NCS2 family permease [Proteiniphilum sp.]|jgi:AGZA family xanthine/uracil permease-like MFS transporter|nr:NCS2 family permease [Proteiniphilum sp.]
MLEKIFKLKQHKTTVRTELTAGIITFLTMSYILVVNPNILEATGMDRGALFTATALATMIGTLFMALIPNLPVAQAPGMGLNSFFAFSVVIGLGYSWQMALTAVFIQGLIFLLLTLCNIRELIVKSIPNTIKNAIPVGIGLFITLLGLQNAGLIVRDENTMITLGALSNPHVWVALSGLILTAALHYRKVHGAFLIGIATATTLAVILGLVHLPQGGPVALPPDITPVFAQFEWNHIFTPDMPVVVFTFLFVNLFDTIGTLLGVAARTGIADENGNFPQLRRALFADALGTTIGALLGTSTVTAYVESASGVAVGGRTGLTALSTATMFGLSLFLAPLFLTVPASATAPALILVGLFMITTVVKIHFDDMTEALPAFLTIVMMPFAFSIAQGIVFGMLSFVLLKTLSGKFRHISVTMWIIFALFIIKILLDAANIV